MVYCTKCGSKNDDTAVVCANCGASLQTGTYASRRYERRRAEQECFGLPHGGAIVGVIIGVLILLWGFTILANVTFNFWPLALIIIGILIVAGAIYGFGRRPLS